MSSPWNWPPQEQEHFSDSLVRHFPSLHLSEICKRGRHFQERYPIKCNVSFPWHFSQLCLCMLGHSFIVVVKYGPQLSQKYFVLFSPMMAIVILSSQFIGIALRLLSPNTFKASNPAPPPWAGYWKRQYFFIWCQGLENFHGLAQQNLRCALNLQMPNFPN